MRKYSLQISVILTIIILLLLCSCGSRRVEVIKKDSISINNSYLEGSKIVLGSVLTYSPLDASKPMQIEGKTYQNVIIKSDKSKTVEKWKNRYITKTVTVSKNKQSEKKDYSIMWIGIAAVIVAGVVAYLKIPSIRL